MRVLDLFSGIGGFSLGLERAGMQTVAFCEIEPYCRAVLKKHWPSVPIFEDVRTLTASQVGAVDLICGGFPCQDISVAGKGAGLAGARSGLWSEYRRLIEEARPAWVIIENVSVLRGRGLDVILGEIAALGYDAEWHCIPASAVGAPHQRDRVWLIAYPNGNGLQIGKHVKNACSEASASEQARHPDNGIFSPEGIHAYADGWQRTLESSPGRVGRLLKSIPRNGDWKIDAEPLLARGANGIPNRLDRNRAIGNSVVPQIPEIIGRAIMSTQLAN